jgi:hypothetical protein
MSDQTIGERIAAGEIGPESAATRGELERCWQRTDRLAAQIEDMRTELNTALERIKALERLREMDEDYRREQEERGGS